MPRWSALNFEVETFDALSDYGGWGIRRRRGTWAFILGGDRGVKLHTRAGRKYLIACREPDRLAAVIRAVSTRT